MDNTMEEKPKSDMITLFWAVTDNEHNLFRVHEDIFCSFFSNREITTWNISYKYGRLLLRTKFNF